MNQESVLRLAIVAIVAACSQAADHYRLEAAEPACIVELTIDRGTDLDQSFGSLFKFETKDGSLVIGAGFQNAYNTRYRADRHAIQLFVRPTDGQRKLNVDRLPRPHRPYVNDRDGFSKLVACSWTPDQQFADLSQVVLMTLPIVGETMFAWGQLADQIVTGANIGGFYVFADQEWRMLLEPKLGVSYQLYSTMSFHDQLRLTMPGHLGAATAWTNGATKLQFTIDHETMSIRQDGKLLASAPISPAVRKLLESLRSPGYIDWGTGIYGDFGGSSISGSIQAEN